MRREGSSVAAKVFLYLNFLTGGNHLEKSFHRCAFAWSLSAYCIDANQLWMNGKMLLMSKSLSSPASLPKPLLCSTDTFHWREIWQENQHFASMTTMKENDFQSLIFWIQMRHFSQFSTNVPSYNFPKVAKIYWFRGQTSWTLSHKLTPWSKKPVFKRAISMMDEFSVFPITSVRYRVEVCGILMSNESRSSDNTVEQCDKIIHFPLSFAYLHHHKIQSTTLP